MNYVDPWGLMPQDVAEAAAASIPGWSPHEAVEANNNSDGGTHNTTHAGNNQTKSSDGNQNTNNNSTGNQNDTAGDDNLGTQGDPPVTGPNGYAPKDQLTNNNFYGDYQNKTKQKGHLIAPPLTQKERWSDEEFKKACMVLAIVDEVFDTHARAKDDFSRNDIMNQLKDDAFFYSKDTEDVLNRVLVNNRVTLKTISPEEFRELVEKGNPISDDQRFALQFTQRTYWGPSYSSDDFHWAGYRGKNSHNVITYDPCNGKLYTNRGTLNTITNVIQINTSNK